MQSLIFVTGDNLNIASPLIENVDPQHDCVVMCEVDEEATYVPQHRQRLVLFFSAMRHFRDSLHARGLNVVYSELDDPRNRGSLGAELNRIASSLKPTRISTTRPGDFRVLQALKKTGERLRVPLEVHEDTHFLSTPDDFAAHADNRRQLVMEGFYRQMRRRHNVLMSGGKPVQDRWNFDHDNRSRIKANDLTSLSPPKAFAPDAITREVIRLVKKRYPNSPGSLNEFDYPVSAEQSVAALEDFVENRLPDFGRVQDAMVSDEPYLFHSRLSTVLNLHLLDPRVAIDRAVGAYDAKQAPINSVEGFVRQILGWREFVRGVYWRKMPAYAELNALNAEAPVPAFMWHGDTDLNCVRHSIGQLVQHGYAHHIQRLMVLGLLMMLLGARPYDVHRWHMSMYVDAIDWVSLPNVLGMSQFADGGIVGTKPYCASGSYISRMSNYCKGCRYTPGKATGDDACPFTTLYWDFLAQHKSRFSNNRRMTFQLKNLDRKPNLEIKQIRAQARRTRVQLTAHTYL
ncbi:MAG: cryptochrome/photolyase family protein [Pseudomonadota bacterium]